MKKTIRKKHKQKSPYIRIKRSYYRTLWILIFALVFFTFYNKVSAQNERTYVEYTVKPGDRLWTIVQEQYQEINTDIREIIYEIKEVNQLSEVIYPGEVVLLPKY